MKNDRLVSLRRLSDAALVAGLENSLTRERDETASVVAHLAELDTRDVHLREGYTSLFVYCRDALGMSEGEAYTRIEVARTARRFPVVLDMLADGRLHLTAARLLGPHLTLDNHCEVLGSARGKTKLEVTITGETREKMRLAKDTLSHAVPTGDDAAILDRAFDALLEKLAKQKFAATDKPRVSRGTKSAGQDLTAAIKRSVWVRDLGRCRYVGPNGHWCNERRFVEFHHTDPRALGGEASVDLIELRCRRHNDYEGTLYFGRRRRPRVLVPEQVDLSVTHSTP